MLQVKITSLKTKLLLAVFTFVVLSGVIISLVVTRWYSQGLQKAMIAQAQQMAHALTHEAVDKILINDLVSLQKMLEQQVQHNPDLGYVFVLRENEVLAHTFEKGIPRDLITANAATSIDEGRLQKIASTSGAHYLDIAWPIFSGKAGVLRLGFSETLYQRQLTRLWIEIGILTLGILLLALTGSLFLIRRITNPLAALAEATKKINKGESEVRVEVRGEDEIAVLASSFNHMVARNGKYVRRLEEQTRELERAHQQTKIYFEMVQGIGALRTLEEVGAFLLKQFKGILLCSHMVLLVFSEHRDLIFILLENEIRTLRDPNLVGQVIKALEGLDNVHFTHDQKFGPPITPYQFESADRQTFLPFYFENQASGALIVACQREGKCNLGEIDVVRMMLNQTAGTIKRAVWHEEEIRNLQTRVDSPTGFHGMIGKNPRMQTIYKLIEDTAPTDATVLIQGESGTGKELVARALHMHSLRADKPFVVINCSAYPTTLLESELFGHEKGAFTGAVRQKPGRFEQAHEGSIFLHEIGEIPPSAQIKLLRVLQTHKFERLGGEKTLSVDIRILAATNKDLMNEVKEGRFREDLYYRLNVIPVSLPPLRERINDIPLLARHFLKIFASEQGKDVIDYSSEAMKLLMDYPWPGNVRELENSIEHAIVLAKTSWIEPSDFPTSLRTTVLKVGPSIAVSTPTMTEHETRLIIGALEECSWNKKLAAEQLGISRSTLYAKLKKYRIVRPILQ